LPSTATSKLPEGPTFNSDSNPNAFFSSTAARTARGL
jgi:hypothetical protein